MTKKIRIGIIGATGYTALELASSLAGHPSATVTVATSRTEVGTPLADVHPSLAGRIDVQIDSLEPAGIAKKCDLAMCCLPHGASAETVKQLVKHGLRVIDFSADFRLSDLATYEKWYGVNHPWPERVGKTVYGMPEFFRDQIADADVVANPGCNSTTAILPLAPLAKNGLIAGDDIIVDAKCGISGAGRGAKVKMLYCERNESIEPYSVGTHRHQPEINDLVQRISGTPIQSLFVPHLAPIDRGILSTIYTKPGANGASADQVMNCWREAFDGSSFVHVVEHLPATKYVAGTNHVQLTARDCGDRIVLICAIDNLSKGASGAAIQNMNVMFGLNEGAGLA